MPTSQAASSSSTPAPPPPPSRPPQDIDCCPIAPLVASGLVTGDVYVHRYGSSDDAGDKDEDDEEDEAPSGGSKKQQQRNTAAAQRQQRGASTSQAAPATGTSSSSRGRISSAQQFLRRGKGGASCRAVRFAADGASLVCGYESGSIQVIDLETGKLAARLPKAHGAGISRLLCLDAGGGGSATNLVVAGDENGGLKIWDLRAANGGGAEPVYKYSKHTDFISGLAQRQGGGGESSTGGGSVGMLVAVSGDGTLSVHDLRKREALARSEDDADDEMLSGGVWARACVCLGGVLLGRRQWRLG